MDIWIYTSTSLARLSGLRALSHHVGSLPKKERSFVVDGKQCNNPVQTYARSAGTTKTLIIEKRKNHLNDPMRRAMTYYEVLCVIVRSFDLL